MTRSCRLLADATQALDDTFYQQPPPGVASMPSRAYQQLRQKIRVIRMEAGALSSSLAKGEGYEETLQSYESLMELVRAARCDALNPQRTPTHAGGMAGHRQRDSLSQGSRDSGGMQCDRQSERRSEQ